jgi:signal transduction histidine kinase
LVADERQIERALENLMSNAVKFTPRGGRIDVSARTVGTDVVVEVRDNGCGIELDEQADLFARFFSSSGARRREKLSAGLGLYIVDQIVHGHGGRMEVVSQPDRGSTFTMHLPTRPAAVGRRASDLEVVV